MDAFEKADLWNTVNTTPNFTCFAPSDAAFQAAGIDIQTLSTERITNLLKYHLVEGDVGYSTALEDGKQYQTMLGVPVTIHKRDGKLFVNNVTVGVGNIVLSNGVAHVLDGVSAIFPIDGGLVLIGLRFSGSRCLNWSEFVLRTQ